MYIYQDGKLYVQTGEYIVGVDISPLNIKKVTGTRKKLSGDYQLLTPSEVRAKFGINTGEEYKFPVEPKKEVVKDEPANKIKKPVKSKRQ